MARAMVRRISLIGMAGGCLWALLFSNSAAAQDPWHVIPEIEEHRFGQERSDELGSLRVPRFGANLVVAYFPALPSGEQFDMGVSAGIHVPIGPVLEVQARAGAFGVANNEPIVTEVSGAVTARASIQSQHVFAFSAVGGALFQSGHQVPVIGAGVEYRVRRIFQYAVGLQYRRFIGDFAVDTGHLLFTLGGNFPVWSLR